VNLVRRFLGIVTRARGALARALELRDIFVFGGLGAITYGVAQIHEPSAWIVVGAALFVLGLRR